MALRANVTQGRRSLAPGGIGAVSAITPGDDIANRIAHDRRSLPSCPHQHGRFARSLHSICQTTTRGGQRDRLVTGRRPHCSKRACGRRVAHSLRLAGLS